jgi:hypothetical protein
MPVLDKIEEITESLKIYVSTNYELIKLQAIERISVIMADLISNLLVGLVVLVSVLFISIWAGFYISASLGDNYSGFAIVGGFYLVIAIFLMIVRNKLVERPIRDKIIRKIFSKK